MIRRTLAIWLVALLAYAGFHVWYDGWRGPLTPAEIDGIMAGVEQIEIYRGRDDIKQRLRQFLSQDDGREFYMVNLLRYRPQPLPAKGVPAGETTAKVMERYSGAFMPSILGRAGWLVTGGRAASGDLERWGVEPDTDWAIFGLVRYRSRRDMAEIITNPQFFDIHPYKFAAIEATRAFPVAPSILTLGPKVFFGLVVLVLALLAQLITGFLARRS